MNYELEELVPILAKLSEKYTSMESTSVTYETAQQLMEAVLYCIAIGEAATEGSNVTTRQSLSAESAYQYGYTKLIEKVDTVRNLYNQMIVMFNAYENENYYETVTKGIPGFFRYYSTKFAPQETIITMDYPTIASIGECSGIVAIERYLQYIYLEQQFLCRLPVEYVINVLYKYQSSYRNQYYNVCSIILRHILGCLIIGKVINIGNCDDDYYNLCQIVLSRDKQELKECFCLLLKKLVHEKYNNNEKLYEYLSADLDDFVTMLITAAENNVLNKVVVL